MNYLGESFRKGRMKFESFNTKFREAKKNINFAGTGLGTTMALVSGPGLAWLQSKTALTLSEELAQLDPYAVGLLTVAAVTLFSWINVKLEAEALRRKKFSNNPVAPALNFATGKPEAAAFLSNAHHMVTLSTINLAATNLYNLAVGSESRVLLEGILATATVLTAYNSITNGLIVEGHLDKYVEKIDGLSNAVKVKVVTGIDKLKRKGENIRENVTRKVRYRVPPEMNDDFRLDFGD